MPKITKNLQLSSGFFPCSQEIAEGVFGKGNKLAIDIPDNNDDIDEIFGSESLKDKYIDLTGSLLIIRDSVTNVEGLKIYRHQPGYPSKCRAPGQIDFVYNSGL